VVALGGRLALAAEDLGRDQERAAVDRRLLQVLAEGDHGPVHHPDPGPLRPGRPIGGGINQHGRLTGGQQPLQPALTKDVIGGHQHEQRLTLDLTLDCGQRRAVAICPPVGVHSPDPAAAEPADDGRDRSGVVANHHQDPLQPSGHEGPHGPLDQAQATQAEQGLGATPVTDSSRSDRPAASTTPTRGSRDGGGVGWTTSARRENAVNGSGGRCGGSAMRQPSRGATRMNAEETTQESPVTPAQARQARNG
jgi:hypothetical protein